MNKNAEKWVEALESGEYTQQRGYLSKNGGFCCLGVACDLYEEQTGDKLSRNSNGDFKGVGLGGENAKVKDWLGLSQEEGRHYTEDGLVVYLSTINDEGTPFASIAEIIRLEPEGLFVEEKI